MIDRPWTRRLAKMAWDVASWVAAAALVVVWSRYQFALNPVQWSSISSYVAALIILQMIAGMFLKLYRGRYRTASFEEGLGLAGTVGVVGAAAAIAFLIFSPWAPAGVSTGRPPTLTHRTRVLSGSSFTAPGMRDTICYGCWPVTVPLPIFPSV